MLYVIIALVVIVILVMIFKAIAEAIEDVLGIASGGIAIEILFIIALIIGFLVGSWLGLVIGAGIYFAIFAIICLIEAAASAVSDDVKEHDRKKHEIAEMNQKTQEAIQEHDNDQALHDELEKNCYWLGYMDNNKWAQKLPNYVNRKYSTDFVTVTNNFAKQNEQQHIVQNDDWLEPFKKYIVEHSGGSTVTKMLNEVACPQLQVTHYTRNEDLLKAHLEMGTRPVSKDVPALFHSTFIKDINENIYTPTRYLQKRYGKDNGVDDGVKHTQEINFDDL